MSDLIKFPGSGVAVRPTKKAGTALISATLDRVAAPLQVAGQCRSELRDVLRKVGEHRYYLPDAKFNHGRMLSRAALVSRTHTALLPVVYPHIVATPTITAETALAMLTVLFRGVGKAKNVETNTLIANCVAMFDPRSDIIGEATGLWTPVSSHPVILALAVKKLLYNSVFTSAAELRTAMREARNSILWLSQDTERWLALLQASDRVLFEHDRAAWDLTYQNVGADVVSVMQNPEEAGDDDEPASPRWSAQEALRLAKQIE
jgi:hypothetical protein